MPNDLLPNTTAHEPAVECDGCQHRFHANKASWNIDEVFHKLRPGHASAHDDLAAPILADEMERVLTDIDSDGGNVGVLLHMG